jgi:hypothetical protein
MNNYQPAHKLQNYTDTKAFVGFSKKFAILAGERVFICRRGGGEGGDARPVQNTEIAS